MINIDADKGGTPWTTISTTTTHINACDRPVSVAASATADYNVAQTVVTATVAPARSVSTGCMNRAGYR